MCGRYAIAQGAGASLPGLFDEAGVLDPNYNVAPGTQVPLVLDGGDDGGAEGLRAGRRLELAHWGLVPSWKKDFKQRPQPINARMETVATNGMFRNSFKGRRCILPASGYFEWQPVADGKQPYFIHPGDSAGLAFAGLYELWPDPDKAEDAPDKWRMTTTIITRTASDAAGEVHDRMPACLDPGSYADWLDPDAGKGAGDGDRLLAMLDAASTAIAATMQTRPVTRRVGNVRNRGAELIEPLPA